MLDIWDYQEEVISPPVPPGLPRPQWTWRSGWCCFNGGGAGAARPRGCGSSGALCRGGCCYTGWRHWGGLEQL